MRAARGTDHSPTLSPILQEMAMKRELTGFEMGQVVATPGAVEALEQSRQSAGDFLQRHARGDWGEELCDEDRQSNDEALTDGSRLLSAYRTAVGTKLWVITEAEDDSGRRSATTLLLPEDY